MEEYKIKKRIVFDWKRSYITLGLLLLVIIFASRAAYFAYGKYRQAQAVLSLEKEELQSSEDKYNFLTASLSAFETERGREDIVRDRFQFVKPGEQVIVIVEDEQGSGDTGDGKESGFIKRILEWIGLD